MQTLGDPAASKSQRRLRAEGLRAMGTIFGACAEVALQAKVPPPPHTHTYTQLKCRKSTERVGHSAQECLCKIARNDGGGGRGVL